MQRLRKSSEIKEENIHHYSNNFFTIKLNSFIAQYEKGNKAPWDNILKKFTTDPNGLRDLPFNEY